MGVHPLDLLIFLTAVVLLTAYTTKIAYTSVWSQQTVGQATQQAAAEPALSVKCWAPAYFTLSHEEYTAIFCTAKFKHLLEGGNQETIYKPAENGSLTTNFTTQQFMDIENAQRIYRDEQGLESIRRGTQGDPSLYYRLYTLVFLMVTLTLVSFAIAIAFGRVARSHAGYLEMAWMNALRGSREPSSGTAAGGQGPLLEKSGIIGARVEMLWSTKTLAIGYLLFQVIVLLLWFILGMCCYQGSTEVMHNIDQVKLMGAARHLNEQLTRGERLYEEFATEEAYKYGESDEEKSQQATRVTDIFFCEVSIRQMGRLHQYTVQCCYDVSRDAQLKSSPSDWLPLMMAWRVLIREGMIYALIIDALILVHIIAFFLLGPLSRQRSLLPVLKRLEVKPKSLGIKFGLSDLSFVASFSMLHGKTLRSQLDNAFPLRDINGD